MLGAGKNFRPQILLKKNDTSRQSEFNLLVDF